MSDLIFKINIETESGNKFSYFTGSFAKTTEADVSASVILNRINNLKSGSYSSDDVVGSFHSGGHLFNNIYNDWLSGSLDGTSESTGSIIFHHTDGSGTPPVQNTVYSTDDSSDRLKRYRFYGTKVCNVLGFPAGQWQYPVNFQLDDTGAGINYFSGDVNANRLSVARDISFSPISNVDSNIRFDIDESVDKFIQFTSGSATNQENRLLIGYNTDNNRFECDAGIQTGDRTTSYLRFGVGSINTLYVKYIKPKGSSNIRISGSIIQTDPISPTNTFLGITTGNDITDDGNYNTAFGAGVLRFLIDGDCNTAVGYFALSDTIASYNIAIGYQAGRYIAGGNMANQTPTSSIYLGTDTKANADGDANEIVIGYNATGIGSNTVVLGNDNITKTALKGNVGIGTMSPGVALEVIGSISGSATSTGSFGALNADKILTVGNESHDSNNWISIYAKDGGDTSGGGITFYETSTYSPSAPTYGAKIVYNEDSDDLKIGTMQNGTFLQQIVFPRAASRIETRHIRPQANDTYDLGSTTLKWNEIYAETISGSEIRSSGNVGIGITNSAARLTVKGSSTSAGGGIRIIESATADYWDIWIDADEHLQFKYNGDIYGGYLRDTANVGYITFTGQHKNLPSTGSANEYSSSIGYIVCADGTYDNLYESGSSKQDTKPNISEALPKVKLSTIEKDKTVFGVVAEVETSGSRTFDAGAWGSTFEQRGDSDVRLIINSVGEGAIWVSNYNGSLENGDYITSSPIEGLGMKQDDDLLHNYTVAKITQDCTFDMNASASYDCVEFEWSGSTYRRAFVGCTYHCG